MANRRTFDEVNSPLKIGIDIGSTTIKCAAMDQTGAILHQSYQRHFSQIPQKTAELLRELQAKLPDGEPALLAVTGSAGMGMAEACGIPFIQEVYADRLAANAWLPDADVVVELGGEDAKILFLTGGVEVRMNGACAGGTGSFIDQMAALMKLTPQEMDELAAQAEQVYTIASRCGVFAKSDIQPLLNQGAKKTDVAMSIFFAVANQTVAGLAQGRPIRGKVVYLGGPLTFLPQLRRAFDETLKTSGLCPENSLYYAALGAALSAQDPADLEKTLEKLAQYQAQSSYRSIPPLFRNDAEYREFQARHAKDALQTADPAAYQGRAALGVDSGSTTLKAAVVSEDGRILASLYQPNNGDPVETARKFLLDFYEKYPQISICASAVTGYGEELIQSAFQADFGVVETMAHFTAAKRFCLRWNLSSTLAGRISSASKSATASSTISFSTKPAPRAAVPFCRPLPTLWAIRRKISPA